MLRCFTISRKALLVAAAALAFASIGHAKSGRKPDFAPGQMWSIKSASPTTAKIIIGRIEVWNSKVAVHVSIIDIPIPQGAPGAGDLVSLDHAPFEKSALAASVNQLLATDMSPVPGFEGGYKNWRSDRSAGIFEISVSRAIALLLEAVIRERA